MKYVVLSVLVVLVGMTAANTRVLREYQRGVLFRLGRLKPLAGPGLVFLIPFVDRMERVDLRTVTLTIPPQEVMTSCGGMVSVTVLRSTRSIRSTKGCLLYTSPSPRDRTRSRMPSSA